MSLGGREGGRGLIEFSYSQQFRGSMCMHVMSMCEEGWQLMGVGEGRGKNPGGGC
jgi:hypothetical protein